MDRDTAIAQIQFDLGNRSDLFDAIALKLQQAQRLLEMGKSLPYFLYTRMPDGIDLEIDEILVEFPERFLREYPDETFRYGGVYLEKIEERNARITFEDADNGPPVAYSITPEGFHVWPAPDRVYTLEFSYYKGGTPLTSNVDDNAWLVNAPDILIGTAGSMIAEVLQHAAAKARFDNLALGAWKGAFAEGVLREEENYPLVMGSRV